MEQVDRGHGEELGRRQIPRWGSSMRPGDCPRCYLRLLPLTRRFYLPEGAMVVKEGLNKGLAQG
jgi:hypothetical protein